MSRKLGFVGNGNMGYAIMKGLIDNGSLAAEQIAVYDPSESVCDRARALGAEICADETDLTAKCDIVLTAVKPQYCADAFARIGKAAEGKLVISIVAGRSVSRIRELLGNKKVRVLRVMPNTPAMVGAGVFGLDANTDAAPEEKELAGKWFESLGVVEWIDESLFPIITGLSGGGPAYVAMFIEALADAGVKYGLKRQTAIRIAAQTVYGSAKLVKESGDHPAVVKDNVCSPAGTTIEGVLALEEGAFRSTVVKCVEKATEKALKL